MTLFFYAEKEVALEKHGKKKKVSIMFAFRVMGKGRLYLAISVIGLILAITANYMVPIITGYTVDYVIGGKEPSIPSFIQDRVEALGGRTFLLDNFLILPALVIMFTVLNGIFVFVRGKFMTASSEEFARNMRNKLYNHLQKVPYDYHKHVATGDIIQRCISDVHTIKRFLSNQLIHIVRTVVMVGVASYIMFSLHARLAVISLSLLPVLCIGGMFYFRYVKKVFERVDVAEGKLSAVLQENVTGVRVVRAFAQQRNEFDKFTDANKDLRKKFDKFYTMMGFYWGVSDCVGYLQVLLTLGAGVIFTVNGSMTLGQLLVFTTYSGMLIWPVKQLGRVLADLGKASVALERLVEILNTEPEKEPGKALCPDLCGDIEFSHVCFGYDSRDDVLSDISFRVKQGETVAILGSTGSGKTSLVHLLQRLYSVTDGTISINGVNINDIEMHHLRKNIGIVLQEPYLYSRSIMENIRITDPEASEEDVFAAAKIASIHDGICEFEQGYDTVVGERGVTLSGGQKQRVAIARMLMQKAPVLIFDDSLSAVDTETDMAIRDALKRSKGNSTTFIISHRITTLCEADHILVLDKGRLVQYGTHNELIRQEGIYKRIAHIQDMDKPIMKGSENGNV